MRLTQPPSAALARAACAEWWSTGIAAGETDRPAAEAAAVAAYRAEGLKPPDRVVWLESPLALRAVCGVLGLVEFRNARIPDREAVMEALVAVAGNDHPGQSVAHVVRGNAAARCGDWILDRMDTGVWEAIGTETGNRVGGVQSALGDRVLGAAAVVVPGEVAGVGNVPRWSRPGGTPTRALGGLGQWDAPWLAHFDLCFRAVGQRVPYLDPLFELARHCGPWMPLDRAVLLTPRPSKVSMDERGRLHREDGAAVCYDDWKLYFWRGTGVPAEWIEQKGSLDPTAALTWPNLEQRRAAAEILGWTRVLSALSPTTINEDADPEIGTLLEVVIERRRMRFLRVRCGTGREFALAVPVSMRTAREANAWTYGLTVEEHKPEVRT